MLHAILILLNYISIGSFILPFQFNHSEAQFILNILIIPFEFCSPIDIFTYAQLLNYLFSPVLIILFKFGFNFTALKILLVSFKLFKSNHNQKIFFLQFLRFIDYFHN